MVFALFMTLNGSLSGSASAGEKKYLGDAADLIVSVLLSNLEALADFNKIVNRINDSTSEEISNQPETTQSPSIHVIRYEFIGNMSQGDVWRPGGKLTITETRTCMRIGCSVQYETKIEPL